MSRLLDLHRRATSRRPQRPPLALTHAVSSTHVLVPLLGIGAALIGLLWGLESWLLEGPARILDEGGLAWVAEHRTTGTLAVARAVTHLGDLWVVLLVGIALVVLARRRSGRWDSAKLVTTVIVGALVTTTASKELTARLRPEDALTSTVSLAFPSGHASRAAAVYALVIWLAIRWAKHPVTRHVVAVLGAGMILATGWSRVLLGAHWPTDVLAGWVLGIVWFVAVLVLTRPVPVERAAAGPVHAGAPSHEARPPD